MSVVEVVVEGVEAVEVAVVVVVVAGSSFSGVRVVVVVVVEGEEEEETEDEGEDQKAGSSFGVVSSSDGTGDEKLLQFLQELKLESLFGIFKESQVQYADLPHLTNSDLAEMKIPVGPKRRILRAIRKRRRVENEMDDEGDEEPSLDGSMEEKETSAGGAVAGQSEKVGQ